MKIQNYINGQFVNPTLGNYIDNYNPSNGEVYGQIPNSTKEDVEKAVEAAEKAFPKWSNTTLEERSKILSKIADLILEKLNFLGEAESKDNGKPISLAKQIDIPRAAANFQFFANALTQFSSEAHESVGLNAINFTLRQPIGVVGCISPWNLPLYLFTWKIAPAIASGNCVIAKPSEITPMTAFLLGEICTEAGLPNGVLNIVHGLGTSTGKAIVEHKNIKAISFTGGTKTGAHIAKVAAPMFKKLSLELGGKNPNIIFADCNYDKMLETTVRSSFANQGQICLCGSRIFVEEKIYEKFKKDFVQKVSELKIGNPTEETTKIGALVSKQHLEKVKNYIDIAENEGGKILFGGNKIEVKNNQCRIHLSGIDLVDGTPILDIKPYLPYADSLADAQASYASDAPDTDMPVQFGEQAEQQLLQQQKHYPELKQFISQVLAQDPRPAYKKQKTTQQNYGVKLYEFNVCWTVENNLTTVISITPLADQDD